jgi:hypothetical protein
MPANRVVSLVELLARWLGGHPEHHRDRLLADVGRSALDLAKSLREVAELRNAGSGKRR